MGVKTIFKVLFGTIVVTTLSFLFIEICNLNLQAVQLNSLVKTCLEKACILYAQETYKVDGSGGLLALDDVEESDGTMYVTGNIFDADTAQGVYLQLYNSTSFRDWLNRTDVKNAGWNSLALMSEGLENPSFLTLPATNPQYSNAMRSKMLITSMVTPINMGITYLDNQSVERIFRWNLAQLLSKCDSVNIKRDAQNIPYVSYQGFRIYAQSAQITRIEYLVLDLNNPTQASRFQALTNIDPANLDFTADSNLATMGLGQEKNKICLAGLHFSVPIWYEGITPIKSAYSYVMQTTVAGHNSGAPTRTTTQLNENGRTNLSSIGGFSGAAGTLPINGELIYYVVR